MSEIQNNLALLHRKEWQTMMPCPSATIAGSFVVADQQGFSKFAMAFFSATVCYLYNHNEDDWLRVASPAFAVTVAAGSCGTYHPWSNTYTANGGSTTTITVDTAVHNINGYVIGNEVEILTGDASNVGLRRTITNISNNGGTGTMTITLDSALPAAVATTDTFMCASGRFFILWAGTLASGYFKSYDIASGVWTNLSVTGLPATWGTDGRLVTTCNKDVSYDSGTATGGSATTLECTGRTWTDDQWINYQVRIVAGTGCGQRSVITDNDADTLTFAAGATIDNTSEFVIEGDTNAIYALGNGAVTLYKHTIGGGWATVSVTAARAGAPAAGMSADFVGTTGNALWADVSNCLDGRYIYSLRGGAGTIIDRFDLSTLAWLPTTGVKYHPVLTTFSTGSSTFQLGEYIYIAKEGSASVAQAFYKFSMTRNFMESLTTDWYLRGAALIGNKMWVKNLSSAQTVQWLYCLGSTSTVMTRIMLF